MQIGQFCSGPSASELGHGTTSARIIHGEELSREAKEKLQLCVLYFFEVRTI